MFFDVFDIFDIFDDFDFDVLGMEGNGNERKYQEDCLSVSE